MAKSKLDLMHKKEKEEELKKKYGIKETTPNVKVLMGRNEEKMKVLTGDKNFGSTVKDAFVKGVEAQSNNQTMLAQNIAKNVQTVLQNYGKANAAYGDAYTRQAENVGNAAKRTADHWVSANAANSEAHLQMGKHIGNQANRIVQKNGNIWGMTAGITGSDQTGASIYGYRNAGEAVVNRGDYQQSADKIKSQIADGGLDVLGHAIAARGLSGGKTLDSYNKFLEYSATGKISNDKTMTPGAYSEIVDEAVADYLSKQHGTVAGDVYSKATKAFDDLTSVALGPVAGAVKSAFDVGGESLDRAKVIGASDQQAVVYGAVNGLRASMNESVGNMVKKLVKSEPLAELGHEIVGDFVDDFLQDEILKDNSEYSNLVNQYYHRGFSKEQSQRIAKCELAKNNIRNASEEVLYRKMFTPAELYLRYGKK